MYSSKVTLYSLSQVILFNNLSLFLRKGQYQIQLLENAELVFTFSLFSLVAHFLNFSFKVATNPTEIIMNVYGDENDQTMKSGIMRVLVADDAVLKQLGLNSTVKTVKIQENTTNTELKDLVLKHMTRGMNPKQLKGMTVMT